MNSTPNRLRDAGHKLISPGFGQPRSGSIRTAHVAAEWNTTLCGKTLSEPSRLSQPGYLHGYKLCTACDRKLPALDIDTIAIA